jgi:hypothetical protein
MGGRGPAGPRGGRAGEFRRVRQDADTPRQAQVGGFGAGAPSAVAAGTWRRTRSSRASSAAPGRAGKPSTGRRGLVVRGMVGRKEVAGEHRRAVPERRRGARAGTSLPAQAARVGNEPLRVLMETRMRWKSQVRFGGRRRGDHRRQGRHWRLAADPARAGAPSGIPGCSVARKQESRSAPWSSSRAIVGRAGQLTH